MKLEMIDSENNITEFYPLNYEKFIPQSRTHQYIDFNGLLFFNCPSIDGPKKKQFISIEVNFTPGIIPSNKNYCGYKFKYDLDKNYIGVFQQKKISTSIENLENVKIFIQEKILNKIKSYGTNSKGYLYLQF